MEGTPSVVGRPNTPEMVEEITLGGQTVRLRHSDVPLDKVKLDRRNQRLQWVITGMGGKATDEELEKELWKISDVKALYRSIQTNQGLIERIIILDDGTVVEGNCRTVCYRKLHLEDPDEPRWQKIPARILPPELDPKLLALLLGEMHVAGKNEWTKYEQAAYVYRMHEDLGFSMDMLAEHLRQSKSTVKKLNDAYKLMTMFLEKYTEPRNIYKFSYFEEFYKKFKKPDPDLEKEFIEWVGSEKLSEGVQVRNLPDIVKHPAAKKALAENGYKAAMRVLEAVDPSYTSKFFDSIDWMVAQFKKAPVEDLQAVRDGDSARIEKLRALHKALKDFAELAKVTLDE